MRFLLAVDSGGTKCEALLADESGRVLGAGRRDHRHKPGERHAGGRGRAEGTVVETVAEALAGASRVEELHVAGRRPADETVLRDRAERVEYHTVREQDGPMALAGAREGLLVLAGTGAFAYGRARNGGELLLDALGPLLGDHGGAHQIGLAAVRAAGRANWHERFATALGRSVPEACKAMGGDPPGFSLVEYMLEPRDRSEIASLAKLVNVEAERGDVIARRILLDAADDLAETARCVVDRLDMAQEELPLVGAGSVAVKSQIYWNRLCKRVREFAPCLRATVVRPPQVMGLVLAMASELGLAGPEFRANLSGGAS
jgi:N-acetylglucosamine kinase-like BadF-type ATPase